MFDSKISKNRSCINRKVGKYLSRLACVLALILLIMPASSTLAAPSANEIANQVTNKFKGFTAVQATVQFQYWTDAGKANKNASLTSLIKADLKNKVIRIEIVKHSLYDGMIVVWNQGKKTASVYMPVQHIEYTGAENKVAGTYGIDLNSYDITSIMTLDTANLTSIKYLRTEKLNRIDHYVVQISTKQSPTTLQDVWVDAETMLVSRVVSYYANGKAQAQVDITDLKGNPTFSSTELTAMPKGAGKQNL